MNMHSCLCNAFAISSTRCSIFRQKYSSVSQRWSLESAMDKAALVDAVKNLQRSDPAIKQAWWDHCDADLGGVKDPNRHEDSGVVHSFSRLISPSVGLCIVSLRFYVALFLKVFHCLTCSFLCVSDQSDILKTLEIVSAANS